MASLLRFAARQGCRALTQRGALPVHKLQPVCFISTSKKNKDAAAVPTDMEIKGVPAEKFEETDDNWMSYGYDLADREFDRVSHHMTMLVFVSLCLCWGGFVIAYMPDHRLRDWSQREGYLELARREKEGLPLVDGNLIDPAKIDLPSEEELGEFNVIV